MVRTDQQILTTIADVINRTAPADWQKVILSAALGEDTGIVRYHYFNASGIQYWFSPEANQKFDVYESFDELRNMMKSAGHSWDRARFTLEKTGKFGIEFDYEE